MIDGDPDISPEHSPRIVLPIGNSSVMVQDIYPLPPPPSADLGRLGSGVRVSASSNFRFNSRGNVLGAR